MARHLRGRRGAGPSGTTLARRVPRDEPPPHGRRTYGLPGRRLPGLRQPQGHALIDRKPYLPEAWAGDAERRRAAKVPEDVPFLMRWTPPAEVPKYRRGSGAGTTSTGSI